MRITNLREKLVNEASLVYDAEYRFLEARERMLEEVSEDGLKAVIREHIAGAGPRIDNLEGVFGELGEAPCRRTCEAARGLVSDARNNGKDADAGPVRDAVLTAAQAEMGRLQCALYRRMGVAAQLLRLEGTARLLRQNLVHEERMAREIEQETRPLLRKAARAA